MEQWMWCINNETWNTEKKLQKKKVKKNMDITDEKNQGIRRSNNLFKVSKVVTDRPSTWTQIIRLQSSDS